MIQKFYLGTYTKRKSSGVYSVELDYTNKKLQNLKLEAKTDNPTYIDLDSENNIYALSNVNKLGGISVLKNNKLANNNFEKSTPCYISYNESKNLILTANYHTGTVCLYENNYGLTLLDKIENDTDIKSHAHFADFTPNDKFVVACYLGTNEVTTYKINNNKLEKNFTYKCKEGNGARHIVFHPNMNIAYLICELDASVEILKFDETSGTLEFINKVNLLENEEDKRWSSAIKITEDGKFLYTSNRGSDYIVAFEILEQGLLKKIQTVQTFGDVARDFNFDKNEQFILVGHQESDNLTLFERNIDGTLQLIEKDFFAPEVVCIKQGNRK